MKSAFKRILLVLGGRQDDEAAIKAAVQLSKVNHATLTVVQVVDIWTRFLKVSNKTLSHTINVRKLITDDIEKRMRNSVGKFGRSTSIKFKILEGIEYIEICKQVKKGRHDLLITSSTTEMKIDTGAFSIADYHLLRECSCPVWVVKPAKNREYKKIMVAVDLDPADKVKSKLNDKLMTTALLLANQYKAQIDVFYSWYLHGERTLRHSAFLGVSKKEVDNQVLVEKKLSAEKLKNYLTKYSNTKIKIHGRLIKGSPAQLIPGFIKKQKIDLLIMGTVCRVGIPGFVIGNTAETVLRTIKCSILTMKPAGFKSPVA